MHTATFDTLSVLKQLMQDNAFTEKQAEKMVNVLKEVEKINLENNATIRDLKDIEKALKRDIVESAERVTYKLTLRIYLAMGAMTTFLCTAIPLIIKHL